VFVWLGIGVLYLVYLTLRHPARVRQMSQVHLVDELDEHERAVVG